MYNGEVHASVYKKDWYLAGVQRRDRCVCTWGRLISRRCTTAKYMRLYIRKTGTSPVYNDESFIVQTVSLRRWSTARYCVLHYTEGVTSPMINVKILRPSLHRRFTSPMINVEILRPSLYRRFHFADDQRRDIASFIIQTVSLRRWSTARYCVLLYTDGFTSPMINGEISDLYYIKNM